MKNKYEMFNDTKIDENEYEDINISRDKKKAMKDRISKKINYKKREYKKNVLVASIPILVAGGIVLNGETSMAYIQNIGKQIEHFFNKNDEELRGYKTLVNETKSDKNIDVTLNEIMLEDKELLLSLTIDDSKLDKDALGISKENDIAEFNEPRVKIGDMMFVNTGGASTSEKSGNKRDVLLKCRLDSVDNNGDGKTDIENFDLLNDLDLSKNYDVEIFIDELGYTFDRDKDVSNDIRIGAYGGGASEDGESYETKTGYISGDWKFKTTLNGQKLAENIKVYNMDKDIDLKYKDMNIKTYIKELRVTPTTIKIKYKYEVDKNANRYSDPIFLDFIIKDEKGKIIESNHPSYDLSSDKESIAGEDIEFEVNKDIKEVEVIPVIRDWNYKNAKVTKFQDKTIDLELNK
jgi:hypothetical protein